MSCLAQLESKTLLLVIEGVSLSEVILHIIHDLGLGVCELVGVGMDIIREFHML